MQACIPARGACANSSQINMGIAMRMAALMQLHREETYQVQNPTPDLIIRAESARRTLVGVLAPSLIALVLMLGTAVDAAQPG